MTTQHPDDKQLRLFITGRLDAGPEKAIEEHLTGCPQCTKRVAELEHSDPLLQKMKAINVSDGDDSSETAAPVVRLSQMSQSVSNVILQGDVLGGNLRLEEKLGRGGMGETWKAFDQTAERHVVLKFVPGEMQHLKEAMESVRSSFQKIHALQHQHICPVYNLVDDPKYGLYIVMKYIDGLTLSEYRRRFSDKNKKMSFNDIVQILWAVAKGLDYAHERKVIHRDIKPGNIMVGRKDGVQIIDFGLAEEIRTLLSQASDAVAMSSSGTRPYMAPEQWQGRVQDARTDQYALAVTAYEMFAGHVPFSGNDVELLKNTVLHDSPEPIANLPEYVNASLFKGLSKKRDERYENCKSLVKALVTKKESPNFVEVADRKFPDGAVTISDLPSDKASEENVAPVWLPDGLSSSSSPSKPQIAAISTSSSLRRALPSWVMPTISALAMLVVCMAGFLGYTMIDKGPKPEKPIVVSKNPESKMEAIVEPEPNVVQEEPEVKEPDVPMSEVAVEDGLTSSEPESKEESVLTPTELTPQPTVQAEPIRLTPEPAEATEIRQQYDEAVEAAIKTYREELDKEFTLAKQNGVLDLVLSLEAELNHLASDDCTEITPFKPEKQALFNAKMRFKKSTETALETYQKSLELLVKELVQSERTDEAKIVREMLDHSGNSKATLSVPKRIPRPLASTIRLTMEIQEDGKGRFLVERGKTTESPPNWFSGIPFSPTGFPKAQGFRGEDGMGRLFFDMANTTSPKEWTESNWFDFHKSVFNQEKLMVQGIPKNEWAHLSFKRQAMKLPVKVQCECICPAHKSGGRISVVFVYKVPGWSEANFWPGLNPNGTFKIDGYCSFPEGKKHHPILQSTSPERAVSVFQLPQEMLDNQPDIAKIVIEPKSHDDSPEFGLTFLDVVVNFSAKTGMEVESRDKKVITKTVRDKEPAFQVGLKEGDEIVRFNGVKRSVEQIEKILNNVRFGDPITIAVLRDGEEKVFRFHAE